MLLNIDKLTGNDRLCQAILGMKWSEVTLLLSSFEKYLIEDKAIRRKQKETDLGRKLQNQGGRRDFLDTPLKKLVFILFYFKVYPTFDVLGWLAGFHRSNAHRQTVYLLKILEKTLGRNLVLPDRKISSPDELLSKFPELTDVFIDATERKVQRPKKDSQQRKLYSRKKKSHTRKNLIVSGKGKTQDPREILVVTKTKSGRRHDKKLSDKDQLFQKLPKDVGKFVDTGFQGVQEQSDKVQKPKKKPPKSKNNRNPQLTTEEKQDNTIISSLRVTAEHAICGIKRFNCLKHDYRNKLPNLDDHFILICSGLWNWHLRLN